MSKKIQELADNISTLNSQLSSALEELSVEATRIYGKPLVADLCNGDEIEFRLANDNGDVIDALEIEVRLETLIKKAMEGE